MTCSVLPIRDCQPHSQPAWRWPLSARTAGATVTLCPETCSLTEMVTGTSNRSVVAEPTPWEAGYQISGLGLDGRSVVVALFTPRQVLVPIAPVARYALVGPGPRNTVGHGLPVAAAAGLVPAPSHQASERPT
jgi:hypothetical protein